MSKRINQQFGSYRLLQLIGRGGFAEVYLGEHIHLGSQVAVKVLNTQLMTREQEEFLEEARLVASLNHPSIVRVLDCGIGEEDDTPYLVMNYAPHGTLRQRHAKGEILPLELIVSYVKQMASALHYAHTKKLIHRDVKPENMLIGEAEEILLSDFGIALISASSVSQSTKATAGTMAYMAPEQIMGKPRMASDQYALGIVVYEWLCGERPFRGGFSELCAQHLYAPPPPMREKLLTIPHKLERIVFKALEKEPLKRYPTIRDFADALEYYSLHIEDEEEDDESYLLLREPVAMQAAYLLPNEDKNTVPQLESSILPVELAHALDAAPYLAVQTTPSLEKTISAPPSLVEGSEKTQVALKPGEARSVIPRGLALWGLRFSRSAGQGKVLRLKGRSLVSLLLALLVIAGSLGLIPLLASSSHSDINQRVHAQVPGSTSTAPVVPGQIPKKGATIVSTQGRSPVAIQPEQLRPASDTSQPPQVVVTTGPKPILVPTPIPTATPTQINVLPATPTPIPTTPVPTIVPTMTPTPTTVPTATPTAVPTPTAGAVLPVLQVTPSSIVNNFDGCSQNSHEGVSYLNSCNLTLSNTSSMQTLNWTGAVSDPGYSLSPSSGSIAPGQSATVVFTDGNQCPMSIVVTFTGPANTIKIPLICTEIRVSPVGTVFNKSNCTYSVNWTCIVTVSALTVNAVDTSWGASSDAPGVTFSLTSGILKPGASVQVTVTIPAADCPGNNNFYFYVPGSTIDGLDNGFNLSC